MTYSRDAMTTASAAKTTSPHRARWYRAAAGGDNEAYAVGTGRRLRRPVTASSSRDRLRAGAAIHFILLSPSARLPQTRTGDSALQLASIIDTSDESSGLSARRWPNEGICRNIVINQLFQSRPAMSDVISAYGRYLRMAALRGYLSAAANMAPPGGDCCAHSIMRLRDVAYAIGA